MAYTELIVKIKGELAKGCDITIAQLAELGYESFEETDYGLKAYIVTDNFDIKALEGLLIKSAKEFRGSEISYGKIETVNWNQEWEKSYDPVSVNDFCHIRALFHDPVGGFRYNLVIHPKMSFGTGHHETTWLMVEAMNRIDFSGKSVLDMGCGTGVLAILAAKMGADIVSAVDIDQWAIENSNENIKLNMVSETKAFLGDINSVKMHKFDVILANITRNVLTDYMNNFSQMLTCDGILLISGFFEEDIDDLSATAKEDGLILSESNARNRWAVVRFNNLNK